MEKRPVYNGYNERYLTGKEIKEQFKDAYGTFGKHHSQVSSTKINFTYYPKILDDVSYRIFINDHFCKIMYADNDKDVYFISYTKNKPSWAKD